MVKITRRQFILGSAGLAAGGLGLLKIKRRIQNKNVRLWFQFDNHETEQDAARIKPLIDKFRPHVVCVEDSNSSEARARATEDLVMSGKPTPLEKDTRFNRELIEIIGRGRARVYVLERFGEGEARRIARLRENHGELTQSAVNYFVQGKPEIAVSEYRRALNAWAEIHSTREENIKGTIARMRSAIVARFPELAEKDELRVLVKYGAAHTPLYRFALRQGFSEVKRDMLKPHYFHGGNIYMRRKTFGINKKDDDEEIAKTLLADILMGYAHGELGASYSNSAAFANLTARELSLEQIKALSRTVSRSQFRDSSALVNGLGAFGKVPTNKLEVEAFLRKRRIPIARG